MSNGDHVVITGVPVPAGGSVPVRLEINDFVKDREQFSLYVQAIQRMYALQQNVEISHFQIGGIHGLPYVQWEGAGPAQPPSDPNDQWGGYCTHGNMLFPPWHRPYVALYEQTLQQNAVEVAKGYNDQAHWLQVAANLRAPYWDWAANSVPPVEITTTDQLTIIGPDGKDLQFTNPCTAYPFHPIDPSFDGTPYSQWQTTLRHPTTSGPDAVSNVQEMISDLQAEQHDWRSKIYHLFAQVHTWPAFSNHTPGDGGSASNSLEGVHDDVHSTVGAAGHMGDPAVAGFDPIFFLHHCNVDRFLALWQALNPNVWVSSGPAEGGTYTIGPNATVDETTALTPFWNGPKSFWTSDDSRSWITQFGYNYPEFVGLNMNDPQAVYNAIATKVKQLYSPQASSSSAQHHFTNFLAKNVVPAAISQSHPQAPLAAPSNVDISVQGPRTPGTVYDWTVRIQFKKFELKTSFSVLVFLGAVPANPAQWRASPSYVGGVTAFANSASSRCANCVNRADAEVEGFVHLNEYIAHHDPGLASFDPEVIVPYLKEKLSWRVQKADRSGIDTAELKSLKVLVVAVPLSWEDGKHFPTPGKVEHHHTITHGKVGGEAA